tara:strand:+ start:1000 stop:1200 length:201 start_codon:yes stop_codon:yes gene_type:complete
MAVNFSQYIYTNINNNNNNNDFDIKEVYRQNKFMNKSYKYQYHKKKQNNIMNRQNYTHGKTSNWVI